MGYRATVITCSDRASADIYEDRSGPIIRDGLTELGFEVEPPVVIPDEVDRIEAEIERAVLEGSRVVITTGGTGIAPKDVTVEATERLLTFQIPGLMEETRRLGAQKTTKSLLSRGLAGVVRIVDHSAFVMNAPGSRGGARDSLTVVGPLLTHIVEQLDGADHPLD